MHCIIKIEPTKEDETLSIFENIIAHQVGWTDIIFPYVPEIKGSKIIMRNIPAWKNFILESEEPFLLALNAVNQHRCIVHTGTKSVALINITLYNQMKEKLRTEFQMKFKNFDIVFARAYLYQTKAMIDFSNEYQIDIQEMDLNTYINTAQKAMGKYLDRYGKDDYFATMVDYFYYSFTSQFQDIPSFFYNLNKLLNGIAFEIGGCSY